MSNKCKKCLLLEAGERVTYEEIMRYVDSLDESERIDETKALKRLEICTQCENLIAGACQKCGCYVEIRARLKDAQCADFDNRRW